MSYRELADFKTLLERYKLHSAGFRSEFDERIRKWAEYGSEDIVILINFDDVTRSFFHTQYLLIPGELSLHQIWYEVIEVFKHREQDQERLVIKLVAVRETGYLPLSPLVDGSPRNDSFSDGRRLWSELPIFSPDLIEEYTTHYWDKDSYNDSQRVIWLQLLTSSYPLASTTARLLLPSRYSVKSLRPIDRCFQ